MFFFPYHFLGFFFISSFFLRLWALVR